MEQLLLVLVPLAAWPPAQQPVLIALLQQCPPHWDRAQVLPKQMQDPFLRATLVFESSLLMLKAQPQANLRVHMTAVFAWRALPKVPQLLLQAVKKSLQRQLQVLAWVGPRATQLVTLQARLELAYEAVPLRAPLMPPQLARHAASLSLKLMGQLLEQVALRGGPQGQDLLQALVWVL